MAVKLNEHDLRFVLDQIKIAEAHSAGADLNDLIPDPHVPWGLRTVSGRYNNLTEGREEWGAADTVMPRYLDGSFINDDPTEGSFAGVENTDYEVVGQPGGANGGHTGNVVDSDPRLISNLIADMSFNNPAVIIAALYIAESEDVLADLSEVQAGYADLQLVLGNPSSTPEARGAAQTIFDALVEGKGIEVQNGSIFLPNIAPDEGISAPFNALTTFFGQFFDHGLDLISKGNNGTIFIPLASDDPLITHGPDGIANTGDELTNPAQQFMVLTRATPVIGADGEINHTNTTTPFVDQNQTYTSHSSHQVFLREYEFSVDSDGDGIPDSRPVATGRLLDGASGGLATWGEVKEQARTMLGIDLDDEDALNIPLLLTDEYGEFIRGPEGLPQIVYNVGPDGIPNTEDDVRVEGDLTTPINTSDPQVIGTETYQGAIRIGHAFLDDIAHTAHPLNSQTGQMKVRNDDGIINDANNNGTTADDETPLGAGEYDGDLFDSHYVTGDGRGNENIALTAIHHVFHSEHNRQVDSIKAEILASGDLDFINEWLITDVTEIPASAAGLVWDGERLFQAGRFATEMQYQHLVFEEFGRKIQPAIDPFVFNASTDIDPSIIAEFANVVYRFGHSMLTETVARTDAAGQSHDIGLIEAFLNPLEFTNNGLWTADEATAAIARGMTVEHGNAIDEFVTGALRNNLLGLPLDLPAINIARARDTGMPTLNEAREQLYQSTGSSFLKPYETWAEFAANLKTPMSVINFIAAYGTHSSIEANGGGMEARRDAAMLLVFGDMDINGDGIAETAPPDRLDFLNSRNGYTTESVGLNDIDMWIGGLAEQILLFGGMLGSTFAALFEYQMEALQDGDRFYYLSRTQGLNFLNELENNAFIKMFYANTDLGQAGPDGVRGTADDVIPMHIGVDAFGQYDYVLEVDQDNQLIDDPTGAADPVLGALGFNQVTRDDASTSDIDESLSTAAGNSLKALLVDGAGNNIGGTVAALKANAALLGITLTNDDLLNAPVLNVNADGTLTFDAANNPLSETVMTGSIVNSSFDAVSLADDGAGPVNEGPAGNFLSGSFAGWDVTTGGLFNPNPGVVDETGRDGDNVVYLNGTGVLSQTTGIQLFQNNSYTMTFVFAGRVNQSDVSGLVQLTNASGTVLAAADFVDTDPSGAWTTVTLQTGSLTAAQADGLLRIEISKVGTSQLLIDNVDVNAIYDPYARDALGDVLRTGQGFVPAIPPGADDATIDALTVNVEGLQKIGHYLRFNGGEHVVLGGTAGNDTIIGSFGDDGIWGDAGDDFIQGGQGVDLIIGGAGDDIILDDGDEGNFIKGDEGDDVIANSNGPFDILMGGDGKDVIFVGLDDTEVFGGEGDDFIAGGEGVDFLLGNEGDDWIEGGGGFDTTAGDNSELFFDSTVIGHDVMFAGNDEHDFDAESGDDIMVQGESVMRNEGMFGFDWVSFQGMRLDAYADMRIRIFTTEAQDILRNRFDKVEALSGWNGNDQLFGDDRVAPGDADDGIGGATVGANENVFFNDSLTQAGVDRINGLREFLGDLIDDRPNLSAEELEGIIAFEEGNILIGGAGNDRIEGNGGNDIISGDHWLNVRISIHAPSSSEEVATVTTMRHVFDGTDGPAEWAGKSLFELLVERTVKPAQMNIVREILLDENSGASFDTAVFQGNIAEYVIEGFGVGGLNYSDQNNDGFIEVRHLDPVAADGITLGIDGVDYLKGIERLEFADRSINQVEGSNSSPTGSIEISNTEPQVGETLTILLAGLADPDGPNPVAASDLSITWEVEDAFQSATFVPVGTGPSLLVTAAMIGLQIRAVARYTDNAGVLEFVSAAPTEIVAGDVAPIGTNGADVLIGTNGADMINGLGGDDEIFGLRGGDTLDGGAGDDIINGGRGNDTLIGGAGNDILDGGQGGNDTAVFDGPLANFTIEFDPDGNIEVVNAATGEEDLILNIENIQFTDQTITFEEARNLAGIIGTPSGDFLTGTAADEFFFAGAGPDTVFAGGGDDTIFGEGGADVLNGEGGADFIDGGNGADTLNGGGGADTLNGGNGDDLLLGGGGADILNGDDGDDVLNGNNGADTLTGGLGNDTINGGNGNDTIIWNVGDGRDVVEGGANGGPGDTFIVNGDTSSESFDIYGPDAFGTIPGGYSGSAQIVVTRNDVIIAELSGIEEIVINAGGGLDTITPHGDFSGTALSQNTITINGGSGDDIVDISALQSAHRILFRTNGGNDTIIGTLRPQDVVELASGTALADYQSMTTNGMTTLSFGAHSIAFPSSGQPTFKESTFSNGSDAPTNEDDEDEDKDDNNTDVEDDDDTLDDDDDAPAPVPPVVAGLAVTGTAAADVMMGSAEADVFSGGAGDDIILGGDDDDTLMGGAGSDLIKGDAGRDMIFGGAGDDVVLGGADNDMIFGDAGDDRMFGDDGDDMLEGGGGSDTVYGGAGNDRFIARQGDGDDIYWGDAGNDTLDYAAITANLKVDLGNGTMQHGSVHSSQSGHDAIFGFENVIGGSGNDEITASSVVNVMDGGGGNDTFVFRTAADADGDRINGFASGDKIDLSGMNGSEGFTLETTVLTGAGQVLVTHLTGDDGEALTRIQGTVSDGAEADFTLEVAGRHLTQSDFIGVA